MENSNRLDINVIELHNSKRVISYISFRRNMKNFFNDKNTDTEDEITLEK